MKVREYIRREYVKPALRFLIPIVIVVGVMLLLNVIGLWIFLFSRGQWSLLGFIELLAVLLLLEGTLIGAAGGFMFYGYSEHGIFRQHAIDPAIVSDQRQRWRERRLSQQKWGVAMLIAGALLIVAALLVSLLTSL